MFDFYTIEVDYIAYLHLFDSEVYYKSTPEYADKPYIGIITTVDNFNYFIPLTSAKSKHKSFKNSGKDYNLIYEYEIRRNLKPKDISILHLEDLSGNSAEDTMKKILAMLDFRKAIPVSSGFYSKLSIRDHKNKDLLNKEYQFLLKKSSSIELKAKNIIQKRKVEGDTKVMYCNFSLLESKCKAWAKEKLEDNIIEEKIVIMKKDQCCDLSRVIDVAYGTIQPLRVDTSICGEFKISIKVVNEFNDFKLIDVRVQVVE